MQIQFRPYFALNSALALSKLWILVRPTAQGILGQHSNPLYWLYSSRFPIDANFKGRVSRALDAWRRLVDAISSAITMHSIGKLPKPQILTAFVTISTLTRKWNNGKALVLTNPFFNEQMRLFTKLLSPANKLLMLQNRFCNQSCGPTSS